MYVLCVYVCVICVNVCVCVDMVCVCSCVCVQSIFVYVDVVYAHAACTPDYAGTYTCATCLEAMEGHWVFCFVSL